MTSYNPESKPHTPAPATGPSGVPTPSEPAAAPEQTFGPTYPSQPAPGSTVGSAAPGYGTQPSYGAHPYAAGSQPQWGTAQVPPTHTTTAPRRKRSGAMRAGSLALVAVLAAGVGGGAALGVDHLAGHTTTLLGGGSTNTTVTKVVQGNTSDPDWSVTAANVAHSVVSITVAGQQGEAEGSGVVWDSNGDIVTNYHVVSALGSNATIQVAEGDKVYSASVVGSDPSTDLAVIKVANPDSDLSPINLATTAATVGEPVMAVGNPLGLSDTVTTGIVSALNRPVATQQDSTSGSQSGSGSGRRGSTGSSSSGDTSSGTVVTNAIQTSAPINPGNSGGALVDANGELIGINSSIASLSSSSSSSTESGSIGIGFAIPVSQVKSIATQLISSGSAQHAYLGVSSSDGTASVGGANVLGAQLASVQSGSPAASAGLQAGDVVTALDNTPVVSSEALVAQIRSDSVGQTVTVTYVRGGQQQQATVKLAAASS